MQKAPPIRRGFALGERWGNRSKAGERQPQLVDFVAAKAKVGGGGFNVVIGNVEITPAAMPRNLTPFLRSVLFVGQGVGVHNTL